MEDKSLPIFKKNEELGFLDIILVPLRWKKMILLLTAASAITAYAISLLLPNMYTATMSILPPYESETPFPGAISSAAALANSLSASRSNTDVYLGILRSRAVADILVEKFNLKELYKKETMTDVYKVLSDRTDVDVSTKSRIISISVSDGDPNRAAEMADAYVEALDRLNRKVNFTEGQRKRIFLEKRLEMVKDELLNAETRLKGFQEKYRLVALEEQAKATIEGAARIKGEIIAAQTELEVFKKFGTERNSEAVRLKSRVAELTNQLSMIEEGNNGTVPLLTKAATFDRTEPNFYIPFNELPELSMQLFRLTRETKVQEKVFELLTSQYELAKIEEARDINTIQVLDRAVPPDRKSSPKRVMISGLSAGSIFMVVVILAYFLEYLTFIETADPDRYRAFLRGLKP